MRDSATEKQLLELTANIVSAHVANNATQTDALRNLAPPSGNPAAGSNAHDKLAGSNHKTMQDAASTS